MPSSYEVDRSAAEDLALVAVHVHDRAGGPDRCRELVNRRQFISRLVRVPTLCDEQ